jgi:hypothetical protein
MDDLRQKVVSLARRVRRMKMRFNNGELKPEQMERLADELSSLPDQHGRDAADLLRLGALYLSENKGVLVGCSFDAAISIMNRWRDELKQPRTEAGGAVRDERFPTEAEQIRDAGAVSLRIKGGLEEVSLRQGAGVGDTGRPGSILTRDHPPWERQGAERKRSAPFFFLKT